MEIEKTKLFLIDKFAKWGYEPIILNLNKPDTFSKFLTVLKTKKCSILIGPSGVGKSTLLRRLLTDFSALIPSISATTRPPRTGETPGVDYHFLSTEEFDSRRNEGRFIECCQVYGREYWYGTLEDEVTPRLTHGKWVILEIDVEGTLSILERYPQAVTIFVEPSDPAHL